MVEHLYTRTEPVLLPYYPRLFYLALVELGYDGASLFDGLDISAKDLQDEQFRLSIDQHERFVLRMLEVTANPHLAIVLIRQQDDSSANVPLLAAANSGKVSKALHMITRYNKLLTRVFSMRFREADDHAVMDIDPHLEHSAVVYFALSAFALSLDGFFQPVLNGKHLIQRAEWAIKKPTGFEEVREEFGFPISFGHARNRIFLDGEFLDQPMKQADPQTVRLLLEMSDRQLEKAEAETGLVGAVKSLVIDRIASPPKLDDVARILGVSARSLRRKLALSDTSYQKLLDSVRLTMATRLIKETKAPIATIGYELGFSNASDFGRAFKKWSGQPPSSLRST